MNKRLLMAGTAALAVATMHADTKIAVVNLASVMQESNDGKSTTKRLQEKQAALAAGINKAQQEYAAEMKKYQDKSATLSEAARQKEQERLLNMERDLKKKADDAEFEFKLAMETENTRMIKRVAEVAKEVGDKNKYDLIIDRASGQVIHASAAITVDAQFKVALDTTTPAAKPAQVASQTGAAATAKPAATAHKIS